MVTFAVKLSADLKMLMSTMVSGDTDVDILTVAVVTAWLVNGSS